MQFNDFKTSFISDLKSVYEHDESLALFHHLIELVDGLQRNDVLFNPEIDANKYEAFKLRLLQQEPLQYITGKAHFYGMELSVDSSVLIPRPETEELVQWVITELGTSSHRIADIGTGSGAIALSLARNLSNASVVGFDVSIKALEVAKENAKRQEINCAFDHLDVLKNPIPDCDVVVSNPPYIMEKEKEQMSANVLQFEPHLALFVESEDPLLFYKEIIQKKGSAHTLFFEFGEHQFESLHTYLNSINASFEFRKDMQGKNRMLKVWF